MLEALVISLCWIGDPELRGLLWQSMSWVWKLYEVWSHGFWSVLLLWYLGFCWELKLEVMYSSLLFLPSNPSIMKDVTLILVTKKEKRKKKVSDHVLNFASPVKCCMQTSTVDSSFQYYFPVSNVDEFLLNELSTQLIFRLISWFCHWTLFQISIL